MTNENKYHLFLGKCDRTEIEPQFFELMCLANKYEIADFRTYFVQIMKEEVKIEDLCMTLDMAIVCCSDDLRDYCLSKIKENWSAVIRFNFFPNLLKESLENILRINCPQRDEMVLFERCIEWARKSCREKGIEDEPANWRLVLGTCIDLIHFANMSSEEFLSLKENGIFTPSEIEKFSNGRVNHFSDTASSTSSENTHNSHRFSEEEFYQWIFSNNPCTIISKNP